MRARGSALAVMLVIAAATTGCVPQSSVPPAELRTTAPPWPAPRDGVAYIEAAGLEQLPLDTRGERHIVSLTVRVAQQPVVVPAYVGVDRLRAVQAVAHTHDETGAVWLEGRGSDSVTLGQFFTLWGVRFDGRCVGGACKSIHVSADGVAIARPAGLRLHEVAAVVIEAS